MVQVFAGVDGGGTRTRVALVTESGEVIGRGESGPGNYRDVGIEGVGQSVAQALDGAALEAGLGSLTMAGIGLGLAGVAGDKDREVIRGLLSLLSLQPGASVLIEHDLRIAHAGAFGGGSGIVVVAGTGSAAYGRSSEGREWKAGGFGSVLDDRGSAYDLGRQALTAALHEHDGRGDPTVLTGKLLEELQLQDPGEIPTVFSARVVERERVASLAPLVTAAAEAGDLVSQGIVKRGVTALSSAVEAVCRRLTLTEPEVSLVGGLVGSNSVYRKPLEHEIAARVPRCCFVDPLLSPCLGAALLVMDEAGSGVKAEQIRILSEGKSG